jgi:signal transduction histidine kinase
VEKQTISNQYQQQEIYAKQAALSIENFFDQFQHSLKYLAKKESLLNFNDQSKILMKNYFEAHINELKAITRVSAKGRIIYTYPFVESVIGKDISIQPHNSEIIKTQKPVISDVFLTVQGYRAIAYAYPIFDNMEYKGCITLVIPFDYIANKYLEDIRIGKTGSSFVVSESGVELYCSNASHIGNSIYENTDGFSELTDMTYRMLYKQEGKAEYYFYKSEIDDEIVKKIAVYKPVHLENTFWSIAVIINEEEVLEANRGFILNFIVLLSLMTLVTFAFLYLFSREKKKSQDILAKKELKYKTELEKLVAVRTDELNKLNKYLQKDITDRKKIEKELKNAVEKVEKSEKIKSEFLAQMSHEIRTPINTILSFSSLIRDELSQYANEELRYGFSGIQSAGKRLIRTIDLILNMSDVQLGTYEYIPKEIDIFNDIIDGLILEYRVQMNEKALEFNIVKKTENTALIADSYTVNQIFANLLDNAIKYTKEGIISIVCERNENDKLIVSIIDTGVGIAKEYLPNLFDEFSQEDMGYTRKFEDNGLGLALVKKYCEINNADISVESEKCKGSIFVIKFN